MKIEGFNTKCLYDMEIGDIKISKINPYDENYSIMCCLNFTDCEKRLINNNKSLLQEVKNIIKMYNKDVSPYTDLSGVFYVIDIRNLKADFKRVYFHTFFKKDKYKYRLVYAKRLKKAVREIENTVNNYKE